MPGQLKLMVSFLPSFLSRFFFFGGAAFCGGDFAASEIVIFEYFFLDIFLSGLFFAVMLSLFLDACFDMPPAGDTCDDGFGVA